MKARCGSVLPCTFVFVTILEGSSLALGAQQKPHPARRSLENLVERVALGSDGSMQHTPDVPPGKEAMKDTGNLKYVHSCPQPGKNVVYLTFDDGACDGVLDHAQKLKDLGVSGTYFMIGWAAKAQASHLPGVVALGHKIGSHTWSHDHLDTDTNETELTHQVDYAKTELEKDTGATVNLFRPPYGALSLSGPAYDHVEKNFELAVWWDIDSQDWDPGAVPDTAALLAKIDAGWSGGSAGHIILMHECKNLAADGKDKLAEIVNHVKSKCSDCVFDNLDNCLQHGTLSLFGLDTKHPAIHDFWTNGPDGTPTLMAPPSF